jgi:hypothetical protein
MRRNAAREDEEEAYTPLNQVLHLQASTAKRFWQKIEEAQRLQGERTASRLLRPDKSVVDSLQRSARLLAEATGDYHASDAYAHAAQFLGYKKSMYSDGWDYVYSASPDSKVSFESLDRVRAAFMRDLSFLIDGLIDFKYKTESAQRSAKLEEEFPGGWDL